MQCKTIDLIPAHKLLQTAADDIVQLRRSFDAVLNEASTIASTWGLRKQFLNKRAKKTKAYFDEISEGITLSDSKKRFCVTVFLPMMGILSSQLFNRFEGMKSVVTPYQVFKPSFLSNASHLNLEVEARLFSKKFSDNVSTLFRSQMLSIKTSFRKKITHLKCALKMASFLIVENALLATTYPGVCTAYMVYITATVTVATAECFFSKLILIKNFLRTCAKRDLAVWLCCR